MKAPKSYTNPDSTAKKILGDNFSLQKLMLRELMYLNPFDNDVTIDFDNIAGTSCLMQLYNLSRRLVISIVLTSKGKIIMAN